jgi:folate-binding protein YgfZ
MPFFAPLPHRALVAVRGEDRISFLQGLVSNDMLKVQRGDAVWAAFLTPQGKFLHEFFAVPHGDAVLLECERARRDDLVTRLSRYKLRAKVSVAADDTLTPGVAWGDGATTAFEMNGTPGSVAKHGVGVVYADPRAAALGLRWALGADQLDGLEKRGVTRATPESYDALRFDVGVPDGSRDMEIEKALLLENGFEELHGVDFEKGCYIGQELTARTHYRALIKKRLMPVMIEGHTPVPGTPLTVDGVEAGEMKSAAGHSGLALVKIDAWKKAGTLDAGGAKITPRQPAWMKIGADAK